MCDRLLYTYAQAGEVLGCSADKVRELVKARQLTVTHQLGPQMPRIRRAELERFASGEHPAAVEPPAEREEEDEAAEGPELDLLPRPEWAMAQLKKARR